MSDVLYKAHGLGNDYLVLHAGPPLDPARVRALCDRHRGPGADGMLEPLGPHGHAVGLRIWNPDGSVAERSGNGLRIFARYLLDVCGMPSPLVIHTGGDTVRAERTPDGIRVAMGRARIHPKRPLEVLGQTLHDVDQVEVGNPHLVVWDDVPDWAPLGAAIEVHPRFPHRTNVQFARRDGPQHLVIAIWERGAGPTQASGSSACAVAAAAVASGRCAPGAIRVEAPGGSLTVEVQPDLELVLDGPVSFVGWFSTDPPTR